MVVDRDVGVAGKRAGAARLQQAVAGDCNRERQGRDNN
jgi:hypothetical protein